MSKLFFTVTLAACCLIGSLLQAQGGYVIVDYMKIKPSMNDKYLECEKVWKLIHQERKRLGKIEGWHLEQMLWPTGTNTEYDYLTATFVKSWDDIGHIWDNWENDLKVLSADQRAIAGKAGEYRDLVKSEIWLEVDFLAKADFKETNYVVENFFNVPAGGWDNYMEMETRFVKPVHQKNIAKGNRSGWVLTRLMAPSGEELPYNCSTVDLYDKWEDMDNDDGKAWEEVYPGMSDSHIGDRINSARKLVRTEIRQVIDSTSL
ncbi:MAG TPA: hypothetical protein PKA00_20745 [Saprospiraceae bacterium]|nr:hypothetical protein [Saprospiraceae bacterium]HMQ85351.1 hypothetical protein [Saprospiraceae bacterium]